MCDYGSPAGLRCIVCDIETYTHLKYEKIKIETGMSNDLFCEMYVFIYSSLTRNCTLFHTKLCNFSANTKPNIVLLCKIMYQSL